VPGYVLSIHCRAAATSFKRELYCAVRKKKSQIEYVPSASRRMIIFCMVVAQARQRARAEQNLRGPNGNGKDRHRDQTRATVWGGAGLSRPCPLRLTPVKEPWWRLPNRSRVLHWSETGPWWSRQAGHVPDRARSLESPPPRSPTTPCPTSRYRQHPRGPIRAWWTDAWCQCRRPRSTSARRSPTCPRTSLKTLAEGGPMWRAFRLCHALSAWTNITGASPSRNPEAGREVPPGLRPSWPHTPGRYPACMAADRYPSDTLDQGYLSTLLIFLRDFRLRGVIIIPWSVVQIRPPLPAQACSLQFTNSPGCRTTRLANCPQDRLPAG